MKCGAIFFIGGAVVQLHFNLVRDDYRSY